MQTCSPSNHSFKQNSSPLVHSASWIEMTKVALEDWKRPQDLPGQCKRRPHSHSTGVPSSCLGKQEVKTFPCKGYFDSISQTRQKCCKGNRIYSNNTIHFVVPLLPWQQDLPSFVIMGLGQYLTQYSKLPLCVNSSYKAKKNKTCKINEIPHLSIDLLFA